jgi:hypothetical protein
MGTELARDPLGMSGSEREEFAVQKADDFGKDGGLQKERYSSIDQFVYSVLWA